MEPLVPYTRLFLSDLAGAAEFKGGLLRIDADQAGRRVAAAERALRAALHLDPVDFAEFVEADARTRAIDAVDEAGDRTFQAGVVADGADAADARRAIGLRSGPRDEHPPERTNVGTGKR